MNISILKEKNKIWRWIFKRKKWNEKGYDVKGNKIYEFINSTGRDIDYNNKDIYYNKIENECKYLHWKKCIEKIYKPE